MSIRHIRFSQKARDQLSQIKKYTKIDHFNVMARWALCASLSENSSPPDSKIPADSNLEMTWEVFGGSQAEILTALLKQRCKSEGIVPTDDNVNLLLRRHVHRGISYLAGDRGLRSIGHLLNKTQSAP